MSERSGRIWRLAGSPATAPASTDGGGQRAVPRVLAAAEAAQARRWDLPSVIPAPPPAPAPVAAPADEPAPPPAPTAEELAAIREQARQEGYHAGLDAATAEAAQRLEQERGTLRDLLQALTQPLAAVDEQVVAELTALACDIARQLVRRELATEPGQIVAVVRETLSLLPVAERRVVLQLHPEDAALVARVLAQDHEGIPWRIEEDPLLSRGGCRVVNGDSSIDATVENRLGMVIARVLGDARRRGEDH